MIKSRHLCAVVFFLAPLKAAATIAESFPRVSMGGGFVGKAGMAEVTLSPFMAGPHISAGIDAGPHEGYGYTEVAASLLITVGVGVGYRFVSAETETNAGLLHLSLSAPIPLLGWTPAYGGGFNRHAVGVAPHFSPTVSPRLLYLVPFFRWRQKFDRSGEDLAFGALLKFSFGPQTGRR